LGIDAHLDKVNSSSTCGVKSLAPAAEISMRTNGSRSLMLAQHDNFSEFESWLHRSNIYRPVCRSFHFDSPTLHLCLPISFAISAQTPPMTGTARNPGSRFSSPRPRDF
jgi:hypothetical protein